MPRGYLHGQDNDILTLFRRRTAENSTKFLLPHLTPTNRLLDIGCGPGSITSSLKAYITSGTIIGVDIDPSVVSQASAIYTKDGLTFQQAGLPNLPFPDSSFDIVLAHMVMHHLRKGTHADALLEMKRVLKPGGLLAVADASLNDTVIAPEHPGVQKFARALADSTDAHGDVEAGHRMPRLVREAGFERIEVSGKVQDFGLPDGYIAFAKVMRARLETSNMVDSWRRIGLVPEDEIQEMKEGLEIMANSQDGMLFIPDVEVLARKPLEIV